jgi:hypothetical protein
MEPGGSLPSSQEPSTGPYPQPDWSSPYYPIIKYTTNKWINKKNIICMYNVSRLKAGNIHIVVF